MVTLRRVVGTSMSPFLQPAQLALFSKRRHYRPGQVVIARFQDEEIVKRLAWCNGRLAYLQGDNSSSTDCFVPLEDLRGALVARLQTLS